MWSQYYQASISQLLRKSILVLCSENVPFEDRLEIDGIICISTAATADKQIVVKVHEIVESLSGERAALLPRDINKGVKSNRELTEQEDEEIFTIEHGDEPAITRPPRNGYTTTSAATSGGESAPGSPLGDISVENGTSEEYTVSDDAGIQHALREDQDGKSAVNLSKRLPCKQIFPFRRVLKTSTDRLKLDHSILRDLEEDKGGEGSVFTVAHQGEYLCRLCETRCPSFPALNAHNYSIHCRFTCRQCLNTFSMMCNLKRHERLHMGRKQYTCAHCAKGFSRNSDLRIHILKAHRGQASPEAGMSDGDGAFSKPQCPSVSRSPVPEQNARSRSSPQPHDMRQASERPPPLQSPHEHATGDHRKGKSLVLGDILTRLAQKQLENLREREKATATAEDGKSQKVQLIEPFRQEQGQDDKGVDKDVMDLSQNSKDDYNEENAVVIEPRSDKEPQHRYQHLHQSAAIPTPQFNPVFTRSILKAPIYGRPGTPPESVIHIYPTSNSSGGGHMEEAPAAKKAKYADGLSASSSLSREQQHSGHAAHPPPQELKGGEYNIHGHGLSFGRIVFPDASTSGTSASGGRNVKLEPVEDRGRLAPPSDVELGLTSLPFLTYTGRKHSLSGGGPERARSEGCISPSSMAITTARSRSSSPVAQPRRARTPPGGGGGGGSCAASPRTSNGSGSADPYGGRPESPSSSASPHSSSGSSSSSSAPAALISLERRYWCHLCKTQWENFSSYEQHHVSQHLRYPCQFCDQTFSNKNNRSRHIRSHTGQKEHVCGDCGKSFSRSDTLKEHQIIHTDGYLGDQCDYCHIIIKKKAELLGHIKKCSQRQRGGRHSASTSPVSSPGPGVVISQGPPSTTHSYSE